MQFPSGLGKEKCCSPDAIFFLVYDGILRLFKHFIYVIRLPNNYYTYISILDFIYFVS